MKTCEKKKGGLYEITFFTQHNSLKIHPYSYLFLCSVIILGMFDSFCFWIEQLIPGFLYQAIGFCSKIFPVGAAWHFWCLLMGEASISTSGEKDSFSWTLIGSGILNESPKLVLPGSYGVIRVRLFQFSGVRVEKEWSYLGSLPFLDWV